AKLMMSGNQSRVFISGTASIAGQETIGLNDIEEQTRITIDHIELLTGKKNLKLHAPKLTIIPDQYAYVRVYVKNEADIPVVKAICRNHFGEVPLSFVQADICREDLLVEIEAEKIGYDKSV
ncbi:MAG: dioxygenase, partial [Bacteroidota bacterium]|nr:dioxygenase [Bacteroidota bacterium]